MISMFVVFSFVNQAVAESITLNNFQTIVNIDTLIANITSDTSKKLCRKGNFLNKTFRSYDGELCEKMNLDNLKTVINHCGAVKSFSESKCMQKALQRKELLVDPIMSVTIENNTITKPTLYRYSNKNFNELKRDIIGVINNSYLKTTTLLENKDLQKHQESALVLWDFNSIKNTLVDSTKDDKNVEIYVSHKAAESPIRGVIASINPLAGNHLSLRIGKKVFEWFNTSYVSIRNYDEERDNIVLVIDPQDKSGKKVTVNIDDPMITKLSLIIHKWNSVKEYSILGDNCQKFAEEMLETMGVNSNILSYKDGIGDYVKYISRAHYSYREVDASTMEDIYADEKNTRALKSAVFKAAKIGAINSIKIFKPSEMFSLYIKYVEDELDLDIDIDDLKGALFNPDEKLTLEFMLKVLFEEIDGNNAFHTTMKDYFKKKVQAQINLIK